MNKCSLTSCLLSNTILLLIAVNSASAEEQSSVRPLLSTDQVENQIVLDKKANPLYESKLLKPILDWKKKVAERTGFNWSLD